MRIEIARAAKGAYSIKGKRAQSSYVAEILNTDKRYGFERDFLRPDDTNWDNYNNKTRKGDIEDIYDLADGVYEVQEFGSRAYYHVKNGDGRKVTEDEAGDLIEQIIEGEEV